MGLLLTLDLDFIPCVHVLVLAKDWVNFSQWPRREGDWSHVVMVKTQMLFHTMEHQYINWGKISAASNEPQGWANCQQLLGNCTMHLFHLDFILPSFSIYYQMYN